MGGADASCSVVGSLSPGMMLTSSASSTRPGWQNLTTPVSTTGSSLSYSIWQSQASGTSSGWEQRRLDVMTLTTTMESGTGPTWTRPWSGSTGQMTSPTTGTTRTAWSCVSTTGPSSPRPGTTTGMTGSVTRPLLTLSVKEMPVINILT